VDLNIFTKDGLKNCTKMKFMEFECNNTITSLNHMKDLEELYTMETILTKDSIKDCAKLRICDIR
jgi:hypothetical protein